VAIRLAELAVRYGCELRGDPDLEVSSVASLADAGSGSITFLTDSGYKKYLADTAATAVILDAAAADNCKAACLVTDNPYAVYASIAAELYPLPEPRPGIHPRALIGDGARVPESCEIAAGVVIGRKVQLGERVIIGPNCVVGDETTVGAETRLMGNVSIYHGVHIGERCIVHSGTVIGADGFGIARSSQGWLKVPQVGGVRIGDDVELGATTTIDRGAIGDTIIGNGVKLDNRVHIGHNVVIGEHTVMAAQCGISGSTRIGARCVFAGQTGLAGHLHVADDVILLGRSSVTKSISKAGTYSSILPVEEVSHWRKLAARFKRLESMAAKIKLLEQRLNSSQDRKS